MSIKSRLGLERKPAPKEKEKVSLLRGLTGSGKTGWGGAIYRTGPSLEDLEYIYRHDPLVFKGVNKKAKDVYREWFLIDDPNDDETIPEGIMDQLIEFESLPDSPRYGATLKDECIQKLIHELVFGDSYLELVTDDRLGADQPIPSGAHLTDVVNLDPKTFSIVMDTKATSPTYGDVLWFVQKIGRDEVRFHPSRIVHGRLNRLGSSPYGLSVLEVAYNSALSKINSDVAYGEMIYRFGHGWPMLTIEGGTQKEVDEAWKLIKKLSPKSGFVGTEKHKLEINNPALMRPGEFNHHFYINLAAALEMPEMLLTGVQKGSVTGSEIDLSDYYKDIANIQEKQNGFFYHLYKMLLGVDEFPWRLFWNPIYVDEKTESDILLKRAQAVQIMYSDALVCSLEEARMIFNEGAIMLEPDVIPEEPVEEREVQKMEDVYARQGEIDRLVKAQIERERRLGEEIIREQEEAVDGEA